MTHKIIPVILCGGAGTRLWPISRIDMPKQFLTLLGDQSLLQQTTMRAQNASGAANNECVFVTLKSTKPQLSQQLNALGKNYTQHILSEPCARNTGPAVALAAHYVAKTFGEDAIMWVLPSDHYIENDLALKTAMQNAIEAANQDYLTTFGIRPTYPETGYGYIRYSEATITKHVHTVSKFVEKPDTLTAQDYMNSGNYLWNSGMFVFKASAVLENFATHAPITTNNMKAAIEHSLHEPDKGAYSALEKIPFDIAIMEKAEKIAVVPCEMGWTDIGSWHSLWNAMQGLNDNKHQTLAIQTPTGNEQFTISQMEIPALEKREGLNSEDTTAYLYTLGSGADITVKTPDENTSQTSRPPENITEIAPNATYTINNTTRGALKILNIKMQSKINAQGIGKDTKMAS